MSNATFKPARLSETVITELMVPAYANFGGKIHGGFILSLMDKVAYVCASKHANAYCVTASVDVVDFLQPVEVGELVSLRAMVNYVGNSSMVIGIRVESENVKSNSLKHTNTSYFTMVALDDHLKKMTVPGLILETQEQVRRFAEAISRKHMNKQLKQEMQQIKKQIELNEVVPMLAHERCQINLPPIGRV
ncbi:MAG: acyl-CoA thioesterase [Bacteroidota bacterium]